MSGGWLNSHRLRLNGCKLPGPECENWPLGNARNQVTYNHECDIHVDQTRRSCSVDWLYGIRTVAWQGGAPVRGLPTTETFRGAPAPPVLITSEQRRYRTRIRKGVVNGEGVWSGSWENTMKTSGPNFAGHYFVIRWGCGSDCLMMAVVDAKTGKVYDPPLSGAGTELYVNMDMLGDREIDFKPLSSLMILRNACRIARSECGVYYFNWQNNRFTLLKRVLIDLTKEQ